ncbi:hypothetical protein N665_0383s0193 [Sinapis alba]|nr:hypothetical protein N665_0383s0193 [Sinapis alba]
MSRCWSLEENLARCRKSSVSSCSGESVAPAVCVDGGGELRRADGGPELAGGDSEPAVVNLDLEPSLVGLSVHGVGLSSLPAEVATNSGGGDGAMEKVDDGGSLMPVREKNELACDGLRLPLAGSCLPFKAPGLLMGIPRSQMLVPSSRKEVSGLTVAERNVAGDRGMKSSGTGMEVPSLMVDLPSLLLRVPSSLSVGLRSPLMMEQIGDVVAPAGDRFVLEEIRAETVNGPSAKLFEERTELDDEGPRLSSMVSLTTSMGEKEHGDGGMSSFLTGPKSSGSVCSSSVMISNSSMVKNCVGNDDGGQRSNSSPSMTSLIASVGGIKEYGTNFSENGPGLSPFVPGSRLSLVGTSSSSMVHVPSCSVNGFQKSMLEILREHEHAMLSGVAQDGESSSDTTSSIDGSSSSGSYTEESVNEGGDGGGKLVEHGSIVGRDTVVDEQRDVDVAGDAEPDDGDSDWDVISGEDESDTVGGDHDNFSDEQDDVFVDANDQQSIIGEDGDRQASVVDILRKIKKESLAASLIVLDDSDGYVRKKKKKEKVKRLRDRPRSFISPLIDHPAESFPSTVCDDEVEWIMSHCCRNGGVEVCIPKGGERPWTVPDGWICVYDFWFTEYHLWFPLPRLLLAFCDVHRIALSQLTPAAIRNMVAALFTAASIGVHMSLHLFEDMARMTRCDKTDGAFYISMMARHGVVTERKRKTYDWIKKFFYVRIASSSVPDVSDMTDPFRSSWNPYNGRLLVSIPLALGDNKCVEHFKATKARDWSLVKRSEVLRCIPFIESASWKFFKRKMDLSEFPSLVDCFAGGSVVASVVETGQCSNSVEPSAPTRGIVMGNSRATAPVPSDGGKEVDGSRAVAAIKRSAGDRSPKDLSSSKTRKVAPLVEGTSSGVELSLAVEPAPYVEKVSFQPFEHSFDGRASNCGDLFKLFRSPGAAGGYPFDDDKRTEWYQEFARHTAIAAKYANRLVYNQDEELAAVKAELDRVSAELAAAKDVDHFKEIAIWRKKYEVEKKVASAAKGKVDKLTVKMASDAEKAKKCQDLESDRHKKEKEALSRRYRRAISRHDDVLATCNSRIAKVRRFVENQKVVRRALHGVNQIIGVLDAVKVWKKEGIKIPDSKVKYLEEELAKRTVALGTWSRFPQDS